MSKSVIVAELPKCDLCKETKKARFDARIPSIGSWANLCPTCGCYFAIELGTGKGQVLVLEGEDPEVWIRLLENARAGL